MRRGQSAGAAPRAPGRRPPRVQSPRGATQGHAHLPIRPRSLETSPDALGLACFVQFTDESRAKLLDGYDASSDGFKFHTPPMWGWDVVAARLPEAVPEANNHDDLEYFVRCAPE